MVKVFSSYLGIRSLQSILLKVCLLLGIKFFFNVEFIEVKEPANGRGWHATFYPDDHLLHQEDFKVLVRAEGMNSQTPGFDKSVTLTKLTIVITANFVNYRTIEEKAVEEVKAVASMINQQFLKNLYEDTGNNVIYMFIISITMILKYFY